MTQWLTINDAAKLPGKPSASTIRRKVKAIAKKESHKDREHVKPSPEILAECEKAGTQPVYHITDELLDRLYSPKSDVEESSDTAHTSNAAVTLLGEQLELKDVRIAQLESDLRQSQNVLQTVLLLGKRRAVKYLQTQHPDMLPTATHTSNGAISGYCETLSDPQVQS